MAEEHSTADGEAANPVEAGAGGVAVVAALEALLRDAAHSRQGLTELRSSLVSLRTELTELMEGVRHGVAGQTVATAELAHQVAQRAARDRSAELEQLLADGLPSFANQLERRLVDQLNRSMESLRTDLTRQTADEPESNDQSLSSLTGDAAQQAADERHELQYVLESIRTDLAQRAADECQEHKESLEALAIELARHVENERVQLRQTLESLRGDQVRLTTVIGQAVRDELSHSLEGLRAALKQHTGSIEKASAAGLALADQVAVLAAEDRSAAIEQLLREGLPRFAQELQERVQQDLRYCLESFRADLSRLSEVVRQQSLDTAKQDAPRAPEDRWAQIEQLLSRGLPQFGQDLQSGVQRTIDSVTRTFLAAEEEHANRVSEIARSFEASAKRIESALQAQRRRELNRPAESPAEPV